MLKYWSPINSPVRDDPTNRVIGIVHHVEDVTSLWAPIHGGGENAADTPDLPAAAEWAKFAAALATNEDVTRRPGKGRSSSRPRTPRGSLSNRPPES